MPRASLGRIPIFQLQDDAILNQPNPVQNTWYTVLDTTLDVIMYGFLFAVQVANENLEIRFTIDGLTRTCSPTPATAGNIYCLRFGAICTSGANWYEFNTVLGLENEALFNIQARSLKIEIRKTTANGAGNLQARLIYGQIP